MICIDGVTFAVAEATVLIFMLALLFAVLIKKNKQRNNKILAALVALICGALVLEILQSCLSAGLISGLDLNALILSQYVITFATVIGTHYYILAITNEYTKVKKWLYFTPLMSVVLLSALFFAIGGNEFISQLKNCAESRPNLFGWVFVFVELSGLVADFVITLVYLNKVKLKNSIMLICYELLPAVAAAFDYRFSTGFAFTVIALLLLVDYIVLGAKQDILIARQRQDMAEAEKRLAVEQTKITISQIQPHFLYNVISSIMACCKTDPEKAVTALADFSDYLRQNMRSIQCDEPIPFSKESEHTETYLRLEKLRFENRLEVEYDIEDNDFFIPSLSVQPLVENAVKHGIGRRQDGGRVIIRTRRVRGGVIVSVIDNGVGFDAETSGLNSAGDHIGLKNVKSRIENMVGGTLDITSSVGKGTTVTVFIPDQKEV